MRLNPEENRRFPRLGETNSDDMDTKFRTSVSFPSSALQSKSSSLNSSFIIRRRKLVLTPFDCKFCLPCRGGFKIRYWIPEPVLEAEPCFLSMIHVWIHGYATVTVPIWFIYILVNMVILHTFSPLCFLMEYPIKCWK